MDIEKVLKRVNDFLPPMPAVKFSVVKEETGLFDSKIGGTPYFPKDMEYPRGKKNVRYIGLKRIRIYGGNKYKPCISFEYKAFL